MTEKKTQQKTEKTEKKMKKLEDLFVDSLKDL